MMWTIQARKSVTQFAIFDDLANKYLISYIDYECSLSDTWLSISY